MEEQLVLHELMIPLIVPSRWQPREVFEEEGLLELAQHIRDHGLMYPIIVFENEDGEYELIAGERRTRAMAALALCEVEAWTSAHGAGLREAIGYVAREGWKKLDVGVQRDMMNPGAGGSRYARITARVEENGDHGRLHELAVADNIQRENLSPLEEARALQGLMEDQGLSQRELARRIGWSQSKLQERLALLGVVDEAKAALTAHAVSASHLRHIARVPEALQGAVTRQVVEMVQREGDQSATVRQVANVAREVRDFVDPSRWATPEGVLKPGLRNRWRLVRHLVESVDQAARADDILQLRTAGHDAQNVLAKRAETVIGSEWLLDLATLALAGMEARDAWPQVATAQGWTCESCRLAGLPSPGRRLENGGWLCPRWSGGEEDEEGTCLAGYTGPGEPLILEAQDVGGWLEDPEGLVAKPFVHFTDYDLYCRALEEAVAAQERRAAEEREKRESKHVVGIRGYWEEQQAGGLFGEVEHFQAHLCRRCANGDGAGPGGLPCRFAYRPLMDRYGSGPVAPEFGVLVREDGLMAPRCAHFRLADVEGAGIAAARGFVLPERKVVLEWMHRLAVGGGQQEHDHTLAGPLAWLPYERPEVGKTHDLEGLLRWVREAWDWLGDERVATLVSVLAQEAKAGSTYRNPMELLNPATGELERWCSVRWERARGRGDFDQWGVGDWPKGWPKPWVQGVGSRE